MKDIPFYVEDFIAASRHFPVEIINRIRVVGAAVFHAGYLVSYTGDDYAIASNVEKSCAMQSCFGFHD